MKKVFKHNNFSWIYLLSPTPSELRETGADFDISISELEDMSSPTNQSLCYTHPSGNTYIVIHMDIENKEGFEEYDILVSNNAVVTVTYSPSELIQGIIKRFEVHAIVDKKADKNILFTPWGFSLYLMSEIYRAALQHAFSIAKKVKQANKDIEDDKVSALVPAKMVRELLTLRDSLHTHGTYLEKISEQAISTSPETEPLVKKINQFFKTLEAEVKRLYNSSESSMSLVSAVKESKRQKFFDTRIVLLLSISLVGLLYGRELMEVAVILLIFTFIYMYMRWKNYL